MLSDLELREKIQYRRLLEKSRAPGLFNLDLRVQKFKAVSHGVCLGYYSTLALACATVDGDGWVTSQMVWSESGVPYSKDYVLDVQKGVYYTRKLKDPFPAPEPEEQAVETAA
jgi:hypothetical protein